MAVELTKITEADFTLLKKGVESKTVTKKIITGGVSPFSYEITRIDAGSHTVVLSYFNPRTKTKVYYAYDSDKEEPKVQQVKIYEGEKSEVNFDKVIFGLTHQNQIVFNVQSSPGSEPVKTFMKKPADFFNDKWILESGHKINGVTLVIEPTGIGEETTKGKIIGLSDGLLEEIGKVKVEDIPNRFKIARDANDIDGDDYEFTVSKVEADFIVELSKGTFKKGITANNEKPRLFKFSVKGKYDSEKSTIKFKIPEQTTFKLRFDGEREEVVGKNFANVTVVSKAENGAPSGESKIYYDFLVSLAIGKEYYLVFHKIGDATEEDRVRGSILKKTESYVQFEKDNEINFPMIKLVLRRVFTDYNFKEAEFGVDGDFINNTEDTEKFEYGFSNIPVGDYEVFIDVNNYYSELLKGIKSANQGLIDRLVYVKQISIWDKLGLSTKKSPTPFYFIASTAPAQTNIPAGGSVPVASYTSTFRGRGDSENKSLTMDDDRVFALITNKAEVKKDVEGGSEIVALEYDYIKMVKILIDFSFNESATKNNAFVSFIVDKFDIVVLDDKYKEGSDIDNLAIPYVSMFRKNVLDVAFSKVAAEYPTAGKPSTRYPLMGKRIGLGDNSNMVTVELSLIPGLFIGDDKKTTYKIALYPKDRDDYLNRVEREEKIPGLEIGFEALEEVTGINVKKHEYIVGKINVGYTDKNIVYHSEDFRRSGTFNIEV